MEHTQIAKQMVDFQKTVFNNNFNALTIMQDQTETMLKGFMDQLPMANEENKTQLDEALAYTKKARDDFKKAVDEGYSQIESLFNTK